MMSDAGNPNERFEVLRKLGRGGMGLVRLARDRQRGGLVALKSLGACDDLAEWEARLRRESRTLERLNHPGIVKSMGIWDIDDCLVLVQEYVEGMTLKQWFDRLSKAEQDGFDFARMLRDIPEASADRGTGFDDDADSNEEPDLDSDEESEADANEESEAETDKPPPPLSDATRHHLRSSEHIRRCCELIRQAAAALGHAHDNGVRHRDVKPENLMIDHEGRVRVIDFGIASFEGSQTWTPTGAVIGSAYYMSPEHLTGPARVNEKSDVFSLGIVLYEALTLRGPYHARTPYDAFHEIVTRPILPLSSRNPSVPPPLEAIVHKATAKDPEDRYRNGNEFEADLTNFLEGRQVSALPYRYKPDYGDIALYRPTNITIFVLISFVLSFFFGLSSVAGLSLLFADPMVRADVMNYVTYVFFVVLGAVAFAIGMGLRHANKVALCTVPLAGLAVAVFSAYLLILEIRSQTRTLFDLILFSSLACTGCYVVVSCAFGLRRIKQWVADAQQIRSQQKRPLKPIL